MEQNPSVQVEEPDIDSIEPLGERAVPMPYVLCRFPADVQRLLDARDPALVNNPMYRRKVRKSLSEGMAKYTMYVCTMVSQSVSHDVINKVNRSISSL